jgi:hypothetical protein
MYGTMYVHYIYKPTEILSFRFSMKNNTLQFALKINRHCPSAQAHFLAERLQEAASVNNFGCAANNVIRKVRPLG